MKPLQAFHAQYPQGILENKCKSIVRTAQKATAALAKPCHIDARTKQSHMAIYATEITLPMTRNKGYNEDYAQVSMTK